MRLERASHRPYVVIREATPPCPRHTPRMLTSIALEGADLLFDPDFLTPAQADAAFASRREAIAWEVHRIRLFGRAIDSPRLSAWIGDRGATYRYSGATFAPQPWSAALLPLRDRASAAAGVAFNSVLANRYRDGRDYMGWHSDDERDLGPAPVIASVSLGATRRFRLKHRVQPQHALALDLTPGSLLLMRGTTQVNHKHALPKSAKVQGERINLTFRRVTPGT